MGRARDSKKKDRAGRAGQAILKRKEGGRAGQAILEKENRAGQAGQTILEKQQQGMAGRASSSRRPGHRPGSQGTALFQQHASWYCILSIPTYIAPLKGESMAGGKLPLVRTEPPKTRPLDVTAL